MGRSILVASGKGGVGRTTFAVNMAASLALKGYKTIIVNLNMGLRGADIYMGLQDKVLFDISDIMSGVCNVEKAIVRDDRFPELYLLETSQNKIVGGVTDGHVKALITQLKGMFDYVIIDGPAAIDDRLTLAAAGAESAVLVLTPDYVALRNTDAADKRLKALGIRSRCYVVNMVKPELFGKGLVPELSDITQVFDIPMAGAVPFDENINVGNNAGMPIMLAPDSYIARNIEDILQRMLG